MVSIKLNTKELYNTLKQLKVAVRGRSPKALATVCEITITDGLATLAVPGAIFNIEGETNGTCKCTVLFIHFMLVIKDIKAKETELQFTKNGIKINRVTLAANTIFFEDDTILRTIQLPINYSDGDILRLMREGYTWEELEFNNLNTKIFHAEEAIKKNVALAQKHLIAYGITSEMLEEFVRDKI